MNLKNEYFRTNIKGIELSKRQYICRFCSRTCDDKSDHTAHIESFHSKLNCQNCDYKTFGSVDLKNHIQNIHHISA